MPVRLYYGLIGRLTSFPGQRGRLRLLFFTYVSFGPDRSGPCSVMKSLGGDPAADSPTATLLRLNPPYRT